MVQLWNKKTEKNFLKKFLETIAPEKLFYIDVNERYLAYWPKGYGGKKSTLQSRNHYIGDYTETWAQISMQNILDELNLNYFAVSDAECKELKLTGNSKADLIVSKSNSQIQNIEDILLIFEIKMSLVWNWHYEKETNEFTCLGDYNSHSGIPA